MKPYVVTIDGPSGSGKGTLALRVAKDLGFHILDSGAIYRLAALKGLKLGIDLNNENIVMDAVSAMEIHLESGDELTIPFLDGEQVAEQIRTEEAGAAASVVAAHPRVREQLLQVQRDFFQPPGLVADGRDMGATVFPEAKIKIFLHASAEERAKRRYKQLISMGLSANIAALLEEIEARDERDRTRSASPMRPASDAVVVDSSMMSLDQVFDLVKSHIDEVNHQ